MWNYIKKFSVSYGICKKLFEYKILEKIIKNRKRLLNKINVKLSYKTYNRSYFRHHNRLWILDF